MYCIRFYYFLFSKSILLKFIDSGFKISVPLLFGLLGSYFTQLQGTGLDWSWLGFAELNWTESDCAVLCCAGLVWPGLAWAGLGWAGRARPG